MSFLENLPIEVFINFARNLEVPEILSLSCVSKEMKSLTNDNQVWKGMYIQKKKSEFHEKEKSIIRKLVFSDNGLEPDMDFDQPIHVNLVIENTSDITFNISHAKRFGRYVRPHEKSYGKVIPHDTRIIRTYVNHRWLIIPRKEKKTNEVYQSKGFLIKSTDISPYPMEYTGKDGETKPYENVVIVSVGDPYDSETAQKVVNKPLPKNPRNYKDFKKMTLRSYVPQVKKCMVKSKNTIDINEYSLLENKEKLARLQLVIQRQEVKIEGEKEKTKKMERFIDVVKKM